MCDARAEPTLEMMRPAELARVCIHAHWMIHSELKWPMAGYDDCSNVVLLMDMILQATGQYRGSQWVVGLAVGLPRQTFWWLSRERYEEFCEQVVLRCERLFARKDDRWDIMAAWRRLRDRLIADRVGPDSNHTQTPYLLRMLDLVKPAAREQVRLNARLAANGRLPNELLEIVEDALVNAEDLSQVFSLTTETDQATRTTVPSSLGACQWWREKEELAHQKRLLAQICRQSDLVDRECARRPLVVTV